MINFKNIFYCCGVFYGSDIDREGTTSLSGFVGADWKLRVDTNAVWQTTDDN
jgi:hypothetical protein